MSKTKMALLLMSAIATLSGCMAIDASLPVEDTEATSMSSAEENSEATVEELPSESNEMKDNTPNEADETSEYENEDPGAREMAGSDPMPID